MKKLKTLFVRFDNKLTPGQVSAFRGAIVEKVGREHLLFHQHKSDRELLYAYPLIQYKSDRGKPAIFCVGDGVDELYKLFEFQNWEINLQGERYALKIDRLDLNTVTLNVWDQQSAYLVQNWVALNEANYAKYMRETGLVPRIQILEKTLVGNILSFAKGVEWHIDKPIDVRILNIDKQYTIRYKGVPLLSFNVSFKCNVFLPNYLGLGKSVSHGYGIISATRKKPEI